MPDEKLETGNEFEDEEEDERGRENETRLIGAAEAERKVENDDEEKNDVEDKDEGDAKEDEESRRLGDDCNASARRES